MQRKVKQGGIYTCELWGAIGCEENKKRPCLVIQNNQGNNVSSTTIILPITSKKKKYPFQHELLKQDYPFFDCEENTVLCEQPRCIDTNRVVRFLGNISIKDFDEIYQKYCQNCSREKEENIENGNE